MAASAYFLGRLLSKNMGESRMANQTNVCELELRTTAEPDSWKTFLIRYFWAVTALLPFACFGGLLAAIVHEVFGHGFTSMLLGGEFLGFQVSFDGMGFANAALKPGDPQWKECLMLASGVIVTMLVGFMLLVFAAKQSRRPLLKLLILPLAFQFILSSSSYLFWNSYQPVPPGDIGRILGQADIAILRPILMAFGGIVMFGSIWCITAMIFRVLERCLSSNGQLVKVRRGFILLLLGVFPAFAWFGFDWNQLAPGIGNIPNIVGALAHLVAAFSLYWVHFRPRPVSPSRLAIVVTIAIGWSISGILLVATAVWLQEGLFWKSSKPESPLETERKLTYFESKSRFVVLIKTSPEDITEVYRNPERFTVDVYWNIDGMTGQVRSPEPATYYAGWSKRLKKVLVLTIDGILLISPDTGEMEDVWKAPGLLSVMRDTNDALSKIVVNGFDPDKRVKFIAAIDLVSGTSKTHEISSMPSGIAFMDHNTAMVSVGKDLLKVEYEQPQGWRFEQLAEPHPEGAVTTTFGGKLVWVSWAWGDKQSKITYGDRTIELPGSFEEAIVHDKGLLVFAASPVETLPLRGGAVYFIDSNWQLQEVSKIKDKAIIGSGSSARGLWVATEDGEVRTFGRTEKTEMIDLP